MIADNIIAVKQRIATCCKRSGRSPDDVSLVCVTKQADIDQMREAIRLGVRVIGENRVQDALEKHRILADAAEWHLIGHLQTNKVRDAVRIFSLIHSLDSIRLAAEIDREAKKIKKVQEVLVQVNVSGEGSKFGIPPDKLEIFLKEAASYQNIGIKGLMTMAPMADDPEEARPHFRRLRELRDRIQELQIANYKLKILSMGMTDDFEVAIEEGSTMVRVGRAIFGG